MAVRRFVTIEDVRGVIVDKSWFFFHVDLKEAQRCFDGEEEDFIYHIQLLGWKSGVRKHEQQEVHEDD